MTSFAVALGGIPLLDRYTTADIVASWWSMSLADLKALATLGYKGLVEAWVTTVLDALDEETRSANPLDHRVVRALLPAYLDRLTSLEAEVAELDAELKAGTTVEDEESGEAPESALSPVEVKALRAKLLAAKKKLNAERRLFADEMQAASAALSADEARMVVLDAFKGNLTAAADDRVGRHRSRIVKQLDQWWDKYQTPLTELEVERASAAAQLEGYLKELGYA